jgi:hypothetical protein
MHNDYRRDKHANEILQRFGETEAGSAEEQPVKG